MYLNDKFEAIQRYMTGQMTSAEITDFESELQQSPELAAELHHWRTLRIVAKHENLFQTKRLLDKLRIEKPLIPDFSDYEPVNPPNAPSNVPQGLFTSSVIKTIIGVTLLSILVGYWGYQYHSVHSEKYYKSLVINVLRKHPAPNVLRLDTTDIAPLNQNFIAAMRLYDEAIRSDSVQKYEPIIQLLQAEKFKNDKRAQFYLAIAQLNTAYIASADAILKKLAETEKENVMRNKARQYWAIALLANGKIKEAKDFLKQLAAEEQQMEPAKTLLENL